MPFFLLGFKYENGSFPKRELSGASNTYTVYTSVCTQDVLLHNVMYYDKRCDQEMLAILSAARRFVLEEDGRLANFLFSCQCHSLGFLSLVFLY